MSTTPPTQRKRRLLILLLGLGLLIAITLLGSSLEALIPRRPSAPVQTAQGGPYQVTLQVTPNPPSLSQQADLTVQIVHRDTQRLVTNARVEIEATMETMDMGTSRLRATQQNNGSYLARFQFTMGGTWALRVSIEESGHTEVVTFEVTAN